MVSKVLDRPAAREPRLKSRRVAVNAPLLACLAALLVALTSGAAAQQARGGAGREDLTQYLPPGEGKALVAQNCSTCHDLSGTVRLRTSREAWEALVLDMVARGAPLLVEEADAITNYLGEVFGPKAPPLVDVNVARIEDLTKIPGITPELADRLIAHRTKAGPFASRGDVRAVLGLDAAAFEKVKWYLRAAPAAATSPQPRRVP